MTKTEYWTPGPTFGRWIKVPKSSLKAGQTIGIRCGPSTTYTVYRPPRPRAESPVAYHKRTGVVDDRFTHVHQGWYYCNPAHCKLRWRDKAERDKHLTAAMSIL